MEIGRFGINILALIGLFYFKEFIRISQVYVCYSELVVEIAYYPSHEFGNEHLKLALPHFWYKPSV